MKKIISLILLFQFLTVQGAWVVGQFVNQSDLVLNSGVRTNNAGNAVEIQSISKKIQQYENLKVTDFEAQEAFGVVREM